MKQIFPFMNRKIKLEDAVKHIETHSKDILDAYDLLILKNNYDIGKELRLMLGDKLTKDREFKTHDEIYDLLGRSSPRAMSKDLLLEGEWSREREMGIYAARRLFLDFKKEYNAIKDLGLKYNKARLSATMMYSAFILLEEMIKRESKK